MKLLAFRIKNFRSIVDTGWCPFSEDNVTVLVGQNESGKSTILEALSRTLGASELSEDDVRIGEPLPETLLCIQTSAAELLKTSTYDPNQAAALDSYLKKHDGKLDVAFSWKADGSTYAPLRNIRSEELAASLLSSRTEEIDLEAVLENTTEPSAEGAKTEPVKELTPEEIGRLAYQVGPYTILFDQASGLLPDKIDILEGKNGWRLASEGGEAAQNFLDAAGLDLKALVAGDRRTREHLLGRANAQVTADFASFWSQTIGKTEKLQLRCDIENYGSDTAEKSGKPHLVFWISDGLNRLYPKQRSQGVRWFVSFYLQLKASEKNSDDRVFLLDEPGANLHPKAQADVLKLINKLSATIPIVYSTHSPHMIEYDKLFRVLAIQRDGEENDSPTRVIHAHKLAAASQDTLSPLLTAMGVDLSHQQVIQKKNNVLLEELSGFYYLAAFWKLTKEKQSAHFLAASGANNVEQLASLFLGWGLEFRVVLDDDATGRNAYNRLRRNMFGDDEDVAKRSLLKIKDCPGIEDVFSKSDFLKLILEDQETKYDGPNSQFVRQTAKPKAVLAYRFWMKVEAGKLKLDALDDDTQKTIKTLVTSIVVLLNSKQPA
jgi:energy-coupling factor transporter ATP-binding protein EcfA2